MDNETPDFAALPKAMFSDKRVKGTHFRVAGVIALHDLRSLAVGKGKGCFASVRTLAAAVSIDPKNCRNAIKDLVRWGYVQKSDAGPKRTATLRIIYTKAEGLGTPSEESNLGVSTPQSCGSGDPPKRAIIETVRDSVATREHNGFSVNRGEADPVDQVIDHWRKVAVPAGAKAIRKAGPERRRLISSRLRSEKLQDILSAIDRISKSRWAMGKANGKDGGNQFRASIDWFLRPGKVNSILEGAHDDFDTKPRKRTFLEAHLDEMRARPRTDDDYDITC